MKTFSEFALEESSSHQQTKTFTVTANSDVMKKFERFLSYVQWCSSVGHSANVAFPIDGDGADRFSVHNLQKWHESKGSVKNREQYVDLIGY